jgi:hypothetical protein
MDSQVRFSIVYGVVLVRSVFDTQIVPARATSQPILNTSQTILDLSGALDKLREALNDAIVAHTARDIGRLAFVSAQTHQGVEQLGMINYHRM